MSVEQQHIEKRELTHVKVNVYKINEGQSGRWRVNAVTPVYGN